MRLPLFIILTFIIVSCSSTRKVSRLYGKCCHQIQINSDKTFEYHATYGIGNGFIRKGTWTKHKGDTILLNTYEQPKIKKTTYSGKVNPYLKNIVRIYIRDFEGEIGGVDVEINDGELVKVSDINGIVEFEINEIKNITYYSIVGSGKIEISNSNYNDIDLLIPDIDLGLVPKYFINQPMVVTKRKVIFYPNDIERRFERNRVGANKKYW